jgi:topoisomerase IA-like protein
MSHVIDDAKNAGLLDGEKSEHITARTTAALLKEAQRQTGITSKTVLVEVALASLALPDPVAQFMKEHRGELGEDHVLDY